MKRWLIISIGSLLLAVARVIFLWVQPWLVTGLGPFIGPVFVLSILVILCIFIVHIPNRLNRGGLENIQFTPTLLFTIGF